MKKDLRALLKKFTTSFASVKNGDLVITAEVHRVTDRNWGRRVSDKRFEMEVETVWPGKELGRGNRIMTLRPGQHGIMKLKR